MGTAQAFSLYVHLPWCRRVCPYCDFNVYAAARLPELAYVEGLLAELDARAAVAPFAGRTLATVYLGGGTPSLFSPGSLARVLAAAARRFGIATGAEISLEANPGTVTRASLTGYRAAGVNRLSLGAQSFHPAHLKRLGRDHVPREIPAAVEAARAAGIDNVSLDLMFAIPGQSIADWERDLTAAVALAPAHLSAYSLTYEEGTPFHTWRTRGRLVPVSEDDEAAMADRTLATLPAAGYARYEISSFARPGGSARHNLAYWNGGDYLGLGAGAHSFTRVPPPGRRWVNERVPARYLAAVRATGTALVEEERLTDAQARAEVAFCGLRQIAGIDLPAFHRRFGVPFEIAFPHVAGLVSDGLLEPAGDRLRLTSRGLRFADAVSATFV